MADAKPSSKKALKAPAEATSKTDADKASSPKKRGWDEIESLFDDCKKKKEAAAAVAAETAKKKKHNNSKPSRADKEPGKLKASEMGGDWVDDGLGGVYNSEGYTGRVEEGVRVFKAHFIQQSPDAGNTELCPFDCKCCYM